MQTITSGLGPFDKLKAGKASYREAFFVD